MSNVNWVLLIAPDFSRICGITYVLVFDRLFGGGIGGAIEGVGVGVGSSTIMGKVRIGLNGGGVGVGVGVAWTTRSRNRRISLAGVGVGVGSGVGVRSCASVGAIKQSALKQIKKSRLPLRRM